MKSPYDIIETILVTEKSTDLQEHGKYVFQVAPGANKIEIAGAVESLYDVKVKSVNVINCKGKPKRLGRAQRMGRRSDWRKAIVTLSEGDINII